MTNANQGQLYETVFITDDHQDKASPVVELIKKLGGTVVVTQPLGVKRFVYPINKKDQGHFAVTRFTINPEKVTELSRQLVLSEKIIRHLTLRLEPDWLAEPKIEKPTTTAEKLTAEPVMIKPKLEEVATAELAKPKLAPPAGKTPTAKKSRPTVKRKPAVKKTKTTKDLDKKLAELLSQ